MEMCDFVTNFVLVTAKNKNIKDDKKVKKESDVTMVVRFFFTLIPIR